MTQPRSQCLFPSLGPPRPQAREKALGTRLRMTGGKPKERVIFAYFIIQ